LTTTNTQLPTASPKSTSGQGHTDPASSLGRIHHRESAPAVTKKAIQEVEMMRLFLDQLGQPPRRTFGATVYAGYEANSAHGSVHAGHQLVPSNHHSPSDDHAASHSLPDHHQTPSGEC
jgi:hypothetical protein